MEKKKHFLNEKITLNLSTSVTRSKYLSLSLKIPIQFFLEQKKIKLKPKNNKNWLC